MSTRRYKRWKESKRRQANWMTLEPTPGYRAGQVNLRVRLQTETHASYHTQEFETLVDVDDIARLTEQARKITDDHIAQLQHTRRRLG